MLFKNISIIDEHQQWLDHMYVGVVGDKIDYVSDKEPSPQEAEKYGEIYDGANKVLMPGFYNAHSHSAMVLLRSREDKLPLQEWLQNNCFPFEAKMTADDHYWGTTLGCAEMLRYGVVSCSDMYFHSNTRIKATNDAKAKINICQHLDDFSDGGVTLDEHAMGQYTKDLVKNHHNTQNGRIKVDACVHSEYITSEKLCRSVSDFAVDNNLILHFHISETERENNECKERHNGMSPTQYFDSIGMFRSKTNLAHGVWIDKADEDILKNHDVTIVTCPASNMKLGSGFADVPGWFEKGINVALGTDGASSNNKYNFFMDMYLMSVIFKGHTGDPCLVSAEQVFYTATRGGALAQGRENCGFVKEGFQADLCVMDLSEPIWSPQTNMVNNLIYSGQGSDVVLTMVDGEVVYRDGNWLTIDIEKAKAEVDNARLRIDKELAN